MSGGSKDSTNRQSSDGAVISECGTYRYSLWREVSPSGSGICLFIMLNPSVADAAEDDPTIRRCIDFTRRWGHRELRVVNLFALRTKEPRELAGVLDPIGLGNDRVLHSEILGADMVVAAWGNRGSLLQRSAIVYAMINGLGKESWHLGLNKTGEPCHPLYVRSSTRLSPFSC